MTMYYSVKEVSQILHVSDKLIYKHIKENKMPYSKIGRKILVPIKLFNEWMDSITNKV